MKKAIKFFITTFCLCMVAFTGKTMAQFSGFGTPNNPYLIETDHHLALMATLVNEGNENYIDKVYKLTQNIDLAVNYGEDFNDGKGWIPIGTMDNKFEGVFDGDNKTVSNLFIFDQDNPEEFTFSGLFGVTANAQIKNLTMQNVLVKGSSVVGGLIGALQVNSTLTNCSSSGTVNGYDLVGGIIGRVYWGSTVSNCFSTCTVTGCSNTGGIAGGIEINSNINLCYSTGLITGDENTGGLTGYLGTYSNIFNCYTAGEVSGGENTGGIVGYIYHGSVVGNCYTISPVSGDTNTGGICGCKDKELVYAGSDIRHCAVLSPYIEGADHNLPTSTVGRIVGFSRSGLQDNVAWIGILNYNEQMIWQNIGANNRDGANITLEMILADNTIGGRFIAALGWTLQNGKLPGLFGNAVNIPEYLVPIFVPVTDIVGLPNGTTVNVPLPLVGTVIPSYANNQTITWSIDDPGTTEATILYGYSFNAPAAGIARVKATINNGTAPGEPFIKIFNVYVRDKDNLLKKNFGGAGMDYFYSVAAVPDGVVATGFSFMDSFENGDWEGYTAKGMGDAILIKYDIHCNLIWKTNFGGDEMDMFTSIVPVSDGMVVCGLSTEDSFNNGDWEGNLPKGDIDATLVKFDHNGVIVWKKNFGGIGSEMFQSVATTSDGFVAVGMADFNSFGTGDWSLNNGRGSTDGIIVRFDNLGNPLWRKNFGGNEEDEFYSVTIAPDGYVAAGVSKEGSFANGDWVNFSPKGNADAIIVKFSFNGDIIWRKNFGGNGFDEFLSVISVPDGYIAVGSSEDDSFGNGDWAGVSTNGSTDAIMVKYDHAGNIVWRKFFGGERGDYFMYAKAIEDGFIAVGESYYGSFATGDWIGYTGRGDYDAILVIFDDDGNVVDKKNFGGNDEDVFTAVADVPGGLVAVGRSSGNSFYNGDWEGVVGKGDDDAIIVKYLIATSGTAPVITTTTLPDGSTDVEYSHTLTATGDEPITWNIESGSLPTGLTLNPNTGEISGIPTVASTFDFTVKAANLAGLDTKDLSIIIIETPATPNIITSTLPDGYVNLQYSQTLIATGDKPITWSIDSGTLPTGLSLNEETGEISGLPTTVNTFFFVIRATNHLASVTKFFSIVIRESFPPTITTTELPDGEINQEYSAFLTATGTAPISWVIDSGELPSGLSLNENTGEIAGIPTAVNDYIFVVMATNNFGQHKKLLTLKIKPGQAIDELRITNYKLQVYPNPTSGELRITGIRHCGLDPQSPANNDEIADQRNDIQGVQVFDITGRNVFTSSLSLLSPETALDISHLPAGVYFVKVGSEMVKVVKK